MACEQLFPSLLATRCITSAICPDLGSCYIPSCFFFSCFFQTQNTHASAAPQAICHSPFWGLPSDSVTNMNLRCISQYGARQARTDYWLLAPQIQTPTQKPPTNIFRHGVYMANAVTQKLSEFLCCAFQGTQIGLHLTHYTFSPHSH